MDKLAPEYHTHTALHISITTPTSYQLHIYMYVLYVTI